MSTQSPDTSPDAERFQIALIRRAGAAARLKRVRSLTASMIGLSRRAIRRAHPSMSDHDVDIAFVQRHYGPTLAMGLKRFLAARHT
jgi:hypothetical protein